MLSFPAENPLRAFERFPAVSLLQILLLSVATLGIYGWWWMYSRSRILNTLLPEGQGIDPRFMHLNLGGFAITLVLAIALAAQPDNTSLEATVNVLSMAINIMALFWLFRFRSALHVLLGAAAENYHFNAFWTFLLQVIYLQHRINMIREHNQPGIM